MSAVCCYSEVANDVTRRPSHHLPDIFFDCIEHDDRDFTGDNNIKKVQRVASVIQNVSC